MVFSSMVFIFVFFPIFLLIYFAVRNIETKNRIIFVASLIFYGYGGVKNLLLLICSIFLNYVFGIWIDKKEDSAKKTICIIAVLIDISILLSFKYVSFIARTFNSLFAQNIKVPEIIYPIGISFFIFQEISYIFDIYYQKAHVQKNLFKLGLYISMFPQLVAGPIVRYSRISDSIEKRIISAEKVGNGCKRFTAGLCKKVLLANNLSVIAEHYFIEVLSGNTISVFGAWFGAIAYTLQIYYDFSGYSDMAIGIGRMLGFDFEENFEYPYIAKTVTEFWRRWHISLSSWFKDYVYIPLGGARKGIDRQIVNLFVVWILTGMWHGANWTFVIWGFLYFIILVLEKMIVRPSERNFMFRQIYTMLTIIIIIFLWVIFNSPDILTAGRYYQSMLGLSNNEVISRWDFRYIHNYIFFIAAAILFCMPIRKLFSNRIRNAYAFKEVIVSVVYTFGLIWSISYLVLGGHNPFIYFNF